jgi:hypothetical protein
MSTEDHDLYRILISSILSSFEAWLHALYVDSTDPQTGKETANYFFVMYAIHCGPDTVLCIKVS